MRLDWDFGDSSRLPPDEGGGGGGETKANPHLRLSAAKRKRAKVKLVYRFDPDDDTAAELILSKGPATHDLRIRELDSQLVATGRLSRGTWKAKLSLAETEDFRAADTCDKLRMKKLPKSKRGRWLKLSTRSC